MESFTRIFIHTRNTLGKLIPIFLILIALHCPVDAAYHRVNATPHDHMMARIKQYLLTSGSGTVSISEANQWMSEIRSIPYKYSSQWKSPSEVDQTGFSDCKGKSVMLFHNLKKSGAKNVALMIGKRTPSSPVQHAWVSWTVGNTTYILDPTYFSAAKKASSFQPSHYHPYYAFNGTGKYKVTL